jgi:flagellar motor switch protein FliG
MSIPRGGGRTIAVLVVLAGAVGVRAAENGDRNGAVMAARVDLQRQLGDWLSKSLAAIAEPYRVETAVFVDLRGVVHEVRQRQATNTPGVKIGGKNRIKLPGLGMVEGGGGQTNLMPEINIEGETRVSETVMRNLETEVAKLKVVLFVDPRMPKDRREFIVRFAEQLAGLDRARGDEIVVEERLSGAPSPTVVELQPSSKIPWDVIAACATALAAAGILAIGVSRRVGGAGTILGGGRGGAGGGAGAAEGAGAGSAAAVAVQVEADARRKRREGLGAFAALADATPRELVQVMAEADPHTAAAVADLVGFDPETAALIEQHVPPQRRVEIGLGLATSRVLTREQLAQLENVAAQVLQRVRNRVPLGGADKLASFLALAPDQIRKEVLEGVAARDQALAEAARRAMVLFEDLPGLSDGSLKQLFAVIDPATAAVAFIGAPEVRDRVHAAVSKRLRSILEAEEEIATERPAVEIEAARHAIESVLRQLHDKGDLESRAA